jgi:LysM repeat protein
MSDRQRLLRRLATYALPALLILLIGLGWRMGVASRATAEGSAPAEVSLDGLTDAAEPVVGIRLPGEAVESSAVAAANLPVIQDAGLSPAANPHTFQGKQPEHQFQTYVVERGDTPNGIAEKFGIQATTLLGGNPQLSQESSLLQTGVELIILPVDGVLHTVQPGETLESISEQYGIPAQDIIAYGPNNLEFPYRLYPDTQILVPGAVRELFVWTPPDLSSVVGRSSREGSGVTPVIVGTGSFIYPVNSRNYTQYYWYGHPGLDIALGEGSAVVAADTGTVTFAGWNIYGYGNLIVVNHGNGYETFYGHLSSINVVPGQIVYKGNVIGASGNSGNSSGPHIHFEIRTNGVQDDPCWYVGC